MISTKKVAFVDADSSLKASGTAGTACGVKLTSVPKIAASALPAA